MLPPVMLRPSLKAACDALLARRRRRAEEDAAA
jgi:hypothetical protein